MNLNIEVSPDDIEKAVTQAIVQSAIGKRITEQVEKAVKDYDLNRAIRDEAQKAVNQAVQQAIMVNEDFNQKIRALVVDFLTDKMVSDLAIAAMNKLTGEWR